MAAALAVPAPAGAQEEPGSSWELAALAGAVRADGDLTAGGESAWSPAWGARLAWRPAPVVTVGIEGWRAAPGEGPEFGAVGARMAVAPGAGRGWPADPVLVFGVEVVQVDDEEERGPAFVAGAGLRKDAGRWTLQAEVLHRLLTVEEEPVDGVETGRDAALWELRVAIGRILG